MKPAVPVRIPVPWPRVAWLLLATSTFVMMAGAQVPDSNGSSNAPDADSPQTPLVQRDEEIRQYDPLATPAEKTDAEKKADREAEKRRQEDNPPIPGSIADSETSLPTHRTPSSEDDDANASSREYAGPAVLTRSYALGQTVMPKSLKLTESLSVSRVFDTGLGETGPNGPQSAGSLTGTTFGWSLSIGHAFRRDTVGVATSGGATYYTNSSYYTGANHGLSAFWTHVITRRIVLNTSFSGAITSANSALAGYSAGPETIANVDLTTSPNIGIFDNGSKQGNLSTSLNWQLTGRWNASATASYFGIIRDSDALYGVTGSGASGNLTYRLTRKMTVGTTYSFNQYVYPHGLQTSDTQIIGGIFSYSLGRSVQIRFNGGMSHTETLGQQTVTIDPIIAAILGVKSGIIDAYDAFSASSLSTQVVKDFRSNGSISFAYARGVTPGNGLFTTSLQKSLSLGYSGKFLRKYSFTISGSRDETQAAVQQTPGIYSGETAQMGFSRGVGHGASANLSVIYRHFDIASFSSLRNQLTISSGFSWGNQNGRLLPF